MKVKKRFFIWLFCWLTPCFALAQTTQEQDKDTNATQMEKRDGLNYAPTAFYLLNPDMPDYAVWQPIDTSVFGAYNDDISLFSRNLYAGLGQFGQAQHSLNYSFEKCHGFCFKPNYFQNYIRTISTWKMYHLETVYSKVAYDFLSGKEHHFSAEHAQQIRDDLHFNLGLETILADGRYVRQGTRDVNVGAGLHYLMPNRRYGFKIYYAFSMIKVDENGGIAADSLWNSSTSNPRSVEVKLLQAQNDNRFHQIFFRHYVSLSLAEKEGKKRINLGYIVHDIDFIANKYQYSDYHLDSNYYSLFVFRTDSTLDKIRVKQLRNNIAWANFMPEDSLPDKPYILHISAGISHTFNQVRDAAEIYSDNQFTPWGMVYAKLFNRLEIKGKVQTTLNGYNAGDITAEGLMRINMNKNDRHFHAIDAKINFWNYAPDYIFTHYISNNYQWDNKLKKQQTLMAQFKWLFDKYDISANYYIHNHLVIFDENLKPAQTNKVTNIYQLAAYIPLDIKGFGWHSNFYLQYCDNKDIQLPIIALRQSVYYGFHLFKKALYLQPGFDFLYNTSYYANAYNPALQQFYLQSDVKIGNYGYLDFFLKAKINRLILQAKLTHFWAGAFGKTYYQSPHYPSKDLGFSVGACWRFYE